MPSYRRQVAFSPAPVYARQPRDDESYVMKAFAKHASHCPSCANPYEVHLEGGSLCAKGHQRALDVAQYVYSKGGRTYSKVDREGYELVQVEIPAGYEAVRSLLKAMERGLRLLRDAPAVSLDKTYLVSPRPVVRRQTTRLETPEPARVPELRRSATTKYEGRGGLYEEEMKERERLNAVKPNVVYCQPLDEPSKKSKYYYY